MTTKLIQKTERSAFGICESCLEIQPITEHHCTPKTFRKVKGDLGWLSLKLCEKCHLLLHNNFTNMQLAYISKEKQLEYAQGNFLKDFFRRLTE